MQEQTRHGRLAQGTRRRTFVALALSALLVAGVALLIGQAASFSRVTAAIQHASVWWLCAAVAGALLGYLGYARLFQALAGLADGPRPPIRLVLRVAVAVFGASVIATAAGRLGGEYWSLRRMRERPPDAWARVLAINIAAWAVLAALALCASLAMLFGLQARAPVWLALTWLAVLPLCTIPAMALTSPARGRLAEDRGGAARRMFAASLRGLVLLRRLATERRVLSRAGIGALIYWVGELLTVWSALRAFGVNLGIAPLIVGYATGYASTMLPLPAGGAGSVDAASTYALTLVGVPLGPALLATVVQRVCTYWLPLAIALLGARSLKRLPGDLAAVAAASEERPESRQPATRQDPPLARGRLRSHQVA